MFFALLAITYAIFIILITRPKKAAVIRNFRECADYGYPVTETFPETCSVPGGATYKADEAAATAGVTKLNLQTTILVDASNGAPDHLAKVIKTQADWVAYWAKAHAHLTPTPPILAVDFTKSMVAAIQLGSEPTDGFHIKISDVYEVTKEVVIQARKTIPGQGCVLPPRPTSPYEIVYFARTEKPTVFDIQTSQSSACATSDPGPGVGKY